jgi:hypothetical protein
VGTGRILHVEYIGKPRQDTIARSTGYRAQIMRRYHGASITQFRLVLGKGKLRSGDDPANGFTLGLKPIYLRECDPEPLLATARLAPLAVLARGDREQRAESFDRALKIVRGDLDHAFLEEAALRLATITLDRSTLDRVLEESGMTIDDVVDFYSGTKFGRELVNRSRAEGIVLMLETLLRDRFGEDPRIEATAKRPAETTDPAAAVHAITHAATIADLQA